MDSSSAPDRHDGWADTEAAAVARSSAGRVAGAIASMIEPAAASQPADPSSGAAGTYELGVPLHVRLVNTHTTERIECSIAELETALELSQRSWTLHLLRVNMACTLAAASAVALAVFTGQALIAAVLAGAGAWLALPPWSVGGAVRSTMTSVASWFWELPRRRDL